MMRRFMKGLFGMLLFAVIFIAGFGMAVQQLWNLLMPQIFSLPALGFWQAVGLLALSWIFFGSWRGMGAVGGRGFGRRHRMSAEERERFRAGMATRCGRAPAAPQAASGE